MSSCIKGFGLCGDLSTPYGVLVPPPHHSGVYGAHSASHERRLKRGLKGRLKRGFKRRLQGRASRGGFKGVFKKRHPKSFMLCVSFATHVLGLLGGLEVCSSKRIMVQSSCTMRNVQRCGNVLR